MKETFNQRLIELLNERLLACRHKGKRTLARGHFYEMLHHGASVYTATKAALAILKPKEHGELMESITWNGQQ